MAALRRRIFAIATDSAGCYLYRLHWPLTHLNPDEFEVDWTGPVWRSNMPADVVVGQRIAGDNPAWLEICADPRILAVYEIDDDIIDVDPANQVPYSIFQPQREGTIANIAAADVVTCSTAHLASKVRQWNPRTVVLPNCLPAEWFSEPLHKPGGGPVAIGWAGSMFHQQDWPEVGPHLTEFAKREPRAQWVTIGADYLSPFVPVAASFGWGTMDSYRRSVDALHVGIAPLAQTEFNQSKSHAKLLEYGARGIPSVSTAWGAYPDFVLYAPGCDAGFTFRRASEWGWGLRELLDDDVRANMSAAARARAEEFQIVNNVWRWADVYRLSAEELRA